MTKPSALALVIHNVRSTHNVGSMLRSAEGLGATYVYLTGYTPYPAHPEDERLPYLANKISRQIHKTALGAETSLDWEYQADIRIVISRLKADGYTICALEQTKAAVALNTYQPPARLALIVGREVEGLEALVLSLCDQFVEIPMHGKKESLNVSVAAAIALFYCQNLQSKTKA